MELAKDTRDRIFAAADSLYDQAGRAAFPTVDAVRKTARANMNDASAGMKEWRRAQTAQAAPVAVQVPEVVQQASGAALAALWREAQELANESLRAAQAGWDAERIEADTLNKEMADAYEVQAAELETAQSEIVQIRTDAGLLAVDVKKQQAELDELNLKLAAATAAAEKADARTVEIERRAADLRAELDHAHQEAAQVRAELAGVRRAHTAEIEALRAEITASQAKAEGAAEKAATTTDALRTELATVKAKAEAAQDAHQEHRKLVAAEVHRLAERLTAMQIERDQVQQNVGVAREEAVALRGQVDATKEQNAKLLKTLNNQGEKQPSKAKKD